MKNKAHWWSIGSAGAGVIFTSVGTAVAASGAAVSWLPVLPFWLVCSVALVIFLSVLVGLILQKRRLLHTDETDQAGA